MLDAEHLEHIEDGIKQIEEEAAKIGNGIPSWAKQPTKPSYTASEVGADPIGSASNVQQNLNAHTGNKSNPHGVTANQIGAVHTSGGTMTGELKTSFKGGVAVCCYGSDATTVPALVEEVRYSSGCMGSFNLTEEYTLNGKTITTGYYNFLYIPHRSGGFNGQEQGDNTNYGTLLLFGMTSSGLTFRVRFDSGAIKELA